MLGLDSINYKGIASNVISVNYQGVGGVKYPEKIVT